ncbi:Lrp/AsnC family transcriptional regulator [Candidatus Woesearchaeota archaeon]|nr:Lrp/AsnC family transcriptional regulator [Candidatus Woesearchaeota archaeon]
MDKKDRRIIGQLMENSRIPVNQLAKKVGISTEVALYRLKKLKKDKIREFYTLVNEKALGYNRFTCFIQLKGISIEQEKKFSQFLRNHEFITYLSPIIGKWNFGFDILAKDNKHLEKIVEEIKSKVPNNIETITIIGTGIGDEVYLIKIVGVKKPIKHYVKLKEHKIDELDRKILSLLSNNSRIEYKEISTKLNLTSNAIKYRIKNLKKHDLIIGYTISVNHKELGYEIYNIQLKLIHSLEGSKIIPFVREHPKLVYIYRYLGNENWDLDIGVIVKDSTELRNVLLELKKEFTDRIKINDVYLISEILKEAPPKGIFIN